MSKKIGAKDRIANANVRITKCFEKIVLFFILISLVLSFLGCSLFQSSKKTKMVEAPPYYQHQHQHQHQHKSQSQQISNVSEIDDSKIFHRANDEIVNVKVFRDTELEKLQRESVELDKMKSNTQSQTTTTTAVKKSWFSSWFGNKEQKNKNSNNNTPYLMSEKAKIINSNL
ncbi:MAG: hypothetical protein LBC74_02370 [Planctomycetaceae bacterium]|jgi:hypothetical protein|nr:hypothetical protein [Planctomycetaceae bacterium]